MSEHTTAQGSTTAHEQGRYEEGRRRRDQRIRTHSGEGRLVQNIVVFLLCLVPLLLAFWLFGLWQHNGDADLFGGTVPGWATFTAALVLYGLTWLIPFSLLGSKTAKRSTSGMELTQR